MLSVNVNSRIIPPVAARRNRPCRPKLLHEFCEPSGCWRIYPLCTATPRQPSGFSPRLAYAVSFLTIPYELANPAVRRLAGSGIIGGCRKMDKIGLVRDTPLRKVEVGF